MPVPRDFADAVKQLQSWKNWDEATAKQYALDRYLSGDPDFANIPGMQEAAGGDTPHPPALQLFEKVVGVTPTWHLIKPTPSSELSGLGYYPTKAEETLVKVSSPIVDPIKSWTLDWYNQMVQKGSTKGQEGTEELLTPVLGHRAAAGVGEAVGNVEATLAYLFGPAALGETAKATGLTRAVGAPLEIFKKATGRAKGMTATPTTAPEIEPAPEAEPEAAAPTAAPAAPTTAAPKLSMFEKPIQQAAAETVRGGPTPEAAGLTAEFEVPPAPSSKPGFLQTAEEKLRMQNVQPIGTMRIREGEPFDAEFLRQSEGRGGTRVYYDYRNPLAKTLPARKLHVDNPAVFEVQGDGEEAIREALRQAYSDDAGTLFAINDTANIKDVGQELLGRWAQANDHDSVVIKSPRPEDNVLFDFAKFKESPHPDISAANRARTQFKKKAVINSELDGKPLSTGNASTPAGVQTVPDVPDEKLSERYHGTGEPIKNLLDHYSAQGTVYGSGFHTTDNYEVAGGYQGEGGSDPSIYRVTETNPANKFLDLEASPIPDDFRRILGDTPIGRDMLFENPQTLRQWYDSVRRRMHTEGKSGIEINTFFDHINRQFEELGYRGIDHIGGNIKEAPDIPGRPKLLHNVRIYWHPTEDIRIERINPEGEPRSVGEAWKDAQTEFSKVKAKSPSEDLELVRHKMAVDGHDVFGPEVAKVIKEMPIRGKKGLSWRLPMNVSNHPAWRKFIAAVYKTHARLFATEAYRMNTIVDRLVEGMSDEDFDEMAYAVQGLEAEQDSAGKWYYKQVRAGIRDSINEKAIKFRQRVIDRLYTLVTGNDPRAYSIMRKAGLPHTRAEFERLRTIQEYQSLIGTGKAPMQPPFKYSMAESSTAERLKGMLRFNDSHDLSVDIREGFFPLNPVENERAYLEDLLAGVKSWEDLKLTDFDTESFKDWATKAVERRKQLLKEEAQEEFGRMPNRDSMPIRHFSGPLKQARSAAAAPLKYSTDVNQVARRFIQNALNKRWNDIILTEARRLSKTFKMDRPMQDYLTRYVQTTRGVTGYRADAVMADNINWFVDGARKLTGLKLEDWDAGDIHRYTADVMRFMFWTKLRLSPIRFPLINLSHLIMTVGSDAGYIPTVRNAIKVLRSPDAYFKRAVNDGIINPESQWVLDMGSREYTKSNVMQGLRKAGAKVVPESVRRGLNAASYFSERLRHVVANEVAHEQYAKYLASGNERVLSPAAVTFTRDVPGRNAITAAKEYARAYVDATQFRTGIEGKPLIMSEHGSTGRMISQFRSWEFGLRAFTLNTLKSGDVPRIARLAVNVTLFGGVGSFMGNDLYSWLRQHVFLPHGINLPHKTGVQEIFDFLGLGNTLGQLDLGSWRDPFGFNAMFGILQGPDEFVKLTGPGPSTLFDTAHHQFKSFVDKGHFDLDRLASDVLGPQAKAAAEAVREKFEGGLFGATGSLEAHRPWLAQVLRGLDLTPSADHLRYEYEQDLAHAMLSGNPQLIGNILDEARQAGIVIDGKFMQGVRSTYSRLRRGQLGR